MASILVSCARWCVCAGGWGFFFFLRALCRPAGQIATGDFEDVGHTDEAREQMKEFKIGTLKGGETEAKPEAAAAPAKKGDYKGGDDSVGMMTYGLFGLAVAAAAYFLFLQ
jgi:hypothetical protein